MLFARARILTGIMVVGVVAFGGPVAAQAASVNTGTVADGGLVSFTPAIDNEQWAQFELDSAATDLTMQVVDDQNNVICQTSLPNSGTQICGWMPTNGAAYTVQVMRPASAAAIAAASAAVDPNAVAPVSFEAGTTADSGLGGATEDFSLTQQ